MAKKHVELILYLKKLILKSLKILKTVGFLRTNLQLLSLLKLFTQFEASKNEVLDHIYSIFNIFSISARSRRERERIRYKKC